MAIKSKTADTFGQMQHEAFERIFEPQLQRLKLGKSDIMQQSLEELFRSLEAVNDTLKHPESFGVVRLKLTAQLGVVVTTTNAESHLEVGIALLLIERKQLILDRINELGGGQLENSGPPTPNTITAQPIFGVPADISAFKNDIFVIMPFAKEFEAVYTDAIKPIGEELNLIVKRGDDFFSHHNIMDEIWFAIYASKVVIADCTGRNPNVFYELGIAHTLGRPYILLTQNVKDAPFDVQGRRFIIYEDKLSSLKTLKTQLLEALSKLLS